MEETFFYAQTGSLPSSTYQNKTTAYFSLIIFSGGNILQNYYIT